MNFRIKTSYIELQERLHPDYAAVLKSRIVRSEGEYKWVTSLNPGTVVTTPEKKSSDWSVRGPQLWARLHQTALVGKLTLGWLTGFLNQIGCGRCKKKWKDWVAANPTPFGTPEGQFVWSVEGHNEVNKELGKKVLTIDQAREVWKL